MGLVLSWYPLWNIQGILLVIILFRASLISTWLIFLPYQRYHTFSSLTTFISFLSFCFSHCFSFYLTLPFFLTYHLNKLDDILPIVIAFVSRPWMFLHRIKIVMGNVRYPRDFLYENCCNMYFFSSRLFLIIILNLSRIVINYIL